MAWLVPAQRGVARQGRCGRARMARPGSERVAWLGRQGMARCGMPWRVVVWLGRCDTARLGTARYGPAGIGMAGMDSTPRVVVNAAPRAALAAEHRHHRVIVQIVGLIASQRRLWRGCAPGIQLAHQHAPPARAVGCRASSRPAILLVPDACLIRRRPRGVGLGVVTHTPHASVRPAYLAVQTSDREHREVNVAPCARSIGPLCVTDKARCRPSPAPRNVAATHHERRRQYAAPHLRRHCLE